MIDFLGTAAFAAPLLFLFFLPLPLFPEEDGAAVTAEGSCLNVHASPRLHIPFAKNEHGCRLSTLSELAVQERSTMNAGG